MLPLGEPARGGLEPGPRGGSVALQAQRVTVGTGSPSVRLVAVHAGHALLGHAALPERAVLEHLVQLLPVRVVEPGLEQAREVMVEEGLPGYECGRQLTATRVTGGAHVRLAARIAGARVGDEPHGRGVGRR